MKTLGQIAILAYENATYDVELSRAENDLRHWEAVAQAVREAVIEECAKVCDEQAALPECPERATYCAEAIRALKDKK